MEKEKEFNEGGCAPSELTGEYLQSVNRQRGKVLDGFAKDDLVTLASLSKICLARTFTLNKVSKAYVAANATSKKKGKVEFGASHLVESFVGENGEKVFRFGDFLSISAAMAALAGKTFCPIPVKVRHQEFADGKLVIDDKTTDVINVFKEYAEDVEDAEVVG